MEIKEYIKGDSTIQGVTVHHKNTYGYEWWRDYDSEGNVIHFKDSNGYECWRDSEGNRIEDPNKVKELTLEEIAEKFGVSVESLRIKD